MSQSLSERRSTNAPEHWPLNDLDQLNDRMRRILEQTFGPLAPAFGTLAPAESDMWMPLVDIEEQDDAYVVEADLPGVKSKDVKIEQVGNELMISGEFKQREREGVVRRKTRRTGKFSYRVALPERVDSENIDARLDSGVLTIRVPKSQRAERRQIQIKS
jgi:HSP20 family protein